MVMSLLLVAEYFMTDRLCCVTDTRLGAARIDEGKSQPREVTLVPSA